jgi:2-methylisocitrate lyase-like PEP mutase family enzyme
MDRRLACSTVRTTAYRYSPARRRVALARAAAQHYPYRNTRVSTYEAGRHASRSATIAARAMDQQQRAELFRSLHAKGSPLVLYNVWDAGSAKAVAESGAQALATSSSALSASHGLPDGQVLPLSVLLETATRIVATTSLPLSVDFEGAYAVTPEEVRANVTRLIATGAIGLNFEDQRVQEGPSWTNGQGMYTVAEQAARIRACRTAADAAGVPLVINARTDLFLKESDTAKHKLLFDEVMERAAAFADAGADCFFIPALENDLELVARICAESPLPVNAMHLGPPSGIAALAKAGVARISHGSMPHRLAQEWLGEQARTAARL